MAVCGIIAEYDPFHKGHARHLRLARERSGADDIVCVMSGSFTQRGVPALLSAHARAEMALRCGADIVLQMPYAFSVREAEYFALGGVYILHALGCVTHLSFGAEMFRWSLYSLTGFGTAGLFLLVAGMIPGLRHNLRKRFFF